MVYSTLINPFLVHLVVVKKSPDKVMSPEGSDSQGRKREEPLWVSWFERVNW